MAAVSKNVEAIVAHLELSLHEWQMQSYSSIVHGSEDECRLHWVWVG